MDRCVTSFVYLGFVLGFFFFGCCCFLPGFTESNKVYLAVSVAVLLTAVNVKYVTFILSKSLTVPNLLLDLLCDVF